MAFDEAADYDTYVDGRNRSDGTSSFLRSRGVELPTGSPDDRSGAATITGLGKAKMLGVEPREAAVFEDALAGVAAGRAGGFGCVVGVDRAGQADALRDRGADRVVTDLAQLLDPTGPP